MSAHAAVSRSGKKIRISPTSAQQYERCPLEWYLARVLGIETPPTKAMARGSDVHDILEAKGKGEVPTPEGRAAAYAIATPGFEHCRPGFDIETWVRVPCGPLDFVGKVDRWRYVAAKKRLVIEDWKTSSNIGEYGKTPEELKTDMQMLGYAYALAEQEGLTAKAVDVAHLYLATSGLPVCVPSRAYGVPWSRVERIWRRYVAIAEAMYALIAVEDEALVPYKLTGCSAYSGCPFGKSGRCARFKPEVAATVGLGNPNAGTTRTTEGARKMGTSKSKQASKLRNALGVGSTSINPPDAAPDVPPEYDADAVAKAAKALEKHLEKRGVDEVALSVVEKLAPKVGLPKTAADIIASAAGLDRDGDVYRVKVDEPEVEVDEPEVEVDEPEVEVDEPEVEVEVEVDEPDAAPEVEAAAESKALFDALEEPEQRIAAYMVKNGTPRTAKHVKAVCKKLEARARMHGKRVDEVLEYLEALDAVKGSLVTSSDDEPEPKPPRISKALAALGYDGKQIDRMNADAVERILAEKLEADGVSILPSGELYLVAPGANHPPEVVGGTPGATRPADEPEADLDDDDDEPEAALPRDVPSRPRLLVLVDCIDLEGEGVPLERYLDEAIRQYEDTKGIPSFTLPDYNDGERHVAASLAKALGEHPVGEVFPGGVVLVSSRSPLYRVVYPILVRIPGVFVVKGTF